MYQKFKDFFTKNLIWKLFSILASICAWIAVMNMNNPIEIKTYSFNINFINEDILKQNNITILNLDELAQQKIEIKISATRPTLLEITNFLNQGLANFTVDLAQLANYTIDPETSYIPVTLTPNIPNIAYPNNSFDVISYSPATIGVVADNIIAVPRKIVSEVLNEVPNGYISFTPIISTSNIQVIGAKSVINEIYKITAPVDVKDQTNSIYTEVLPVAYDANGKVIENIEFNPEIVQVEVPISKRSSIAITNPTVIGTLADGYLIKDVTLSHKFVEVTGSTANISKLGSIELQTIDVTGLNQTTTFTQDISSILSKNSLSSSDNISKISITVELEKLATRTIELQQIDINVLGNLEATGVKILSEKISFTMQGQKEFLDMITLDSLNPFINITGFDDGIAYIPLNITLPVGITLVEKPLVEVDLTILGNESTENTEDLEDLEDLEGLEDLENLDGVDEDGDTLLEDDLDNQNNNDNIEGLEDLENSSTQDTSTENTSTGNTNVTDDTAPEDENIEPLPENTSDSNSSSTTSASSDLNTDESTENIESTESIESIESSTQEILDYFDGFDTEENSNTTSSQEEATNLDLQQSMSTTINRINTTNLINTTEISNINTSYTNNTNNTNNTETTTNLTNILLENLENLENMDSLIDNYNYSTIEITTEITSERTTID